MTGFSTIRLLNRLTQDLDRTGFELTQSKHGGDQLAVRPTREHYPIYNRDAELFVGTLEEVDVWLMGFKLARQYDCLLTDKTIETVRVRAEKDFVNKNLIDKIKDSDQ